MLTTEYKARAIKESSLTTIERVFGGFLHKRRDMIKNGNYYVVQGWMLKMGLSGVKLQVYAIIYGFTQNGEDEYCGSASYLAEWCGCSKRTIFSTLNDLVEQCFIKKTEYQVNGVKFVKYCTNFTSSEKISLPPSEKISPNNIDNNIKKCVKKKPTIEEIKQYAIEKHREDLAQLFYDYYEATEWKDSKGKPVLSWKGKFITWMNNNEMNEPRKPAFSCERHYTKEELNSVFKPIEETDIT